MTEQSRPCLPCCLTTCFGVQKCGGVYSFHHKALTDCWLSQWATHYMNVQDSWGSLGSKPQNRKKICCLHKLERIKTQESEFKNGVTNFLLSKTKPIWWNGSNFLCAMKVKKNKCCGVCKVAKISAGYICQNGACWCEIVCGWDRLQIHPPVFKHFLHLKAADV